MIVCADNVTVSIRFFCLFTQQVALSLTTLLCGVTSRANIVGLVALHADQKVLIQTMQIHCGKNTTSTLRLQALMNGSALMQYEGTIRIEENASGAYALQNNKNILLSKAASAISVPNIEVMNNDVQCYHGAAMGRFDEAHVQYLQSRGLTAKVIQQLLIRAFFVDVLQGYEKKESILQTIYEKI